MLRLACGPVPAIAVEVDGNQIKISNYLITPIPSTTNSANPAHLVTLQGSYTNNSNSQISELSLTLASSKAIENRTILGNLISNAYEVPDMTETKISARLSNLSPGESRSWQITFNWEQVLGLNAAGVFAIGAVPDSKEYGSTAAIPIPWFYNSNIKPTQVALTIPLTSLNSHLANGTSLNDAADLNEAKRLLALLQSSNNSASSWLLDSATTGWAEDLVTNSNSKVARELVEALKSLPAQTLISPFGYANFSALIKSGKQNEADEVIEKTLSQSDGKVIYSPATGISDRETISFLNQQNIKTIISNDSIHANERITTNASVRAFSSNVMVFDVAASDCLKKVSGEQDSYFKTLICLKAEIGMITAESPQNARSVIVLAPTTWQISASELSELFFQLQNNNWMTLVSLQEISMDSPVESYLPVSKIFPQEFSRTLINQSNRLKLDTESVSALYDDPELASSFTVARLLGYSDLWPSNAQASRYFEQNSKLLAEYLTAIKIEASTRVTTPEVDSQIPITIVNDSDKDITVSLELTSASTSRFKAQPSGLIKVAQGQRVTIPISINLIGAGVVTAKAQLIAPNGERFGNGKEMQISSAAYSQFARTLVLGAFGLLLLLSIGNFVRRRRENRRTKMQSLIAG